MRKRETGSHVASVHIRLDLASDTNRFVLISDTISRLNLNSQSRLRRNANRFAERLLLAEEAL